MNIEGTVIDSSITDKAVEIKTAIVESGKVNQIAASWVAEVFTACTVVVSELKSTDKAAKVVLAECWKEIALDTKAQAHINRRKEITRLVGFKSAVVSKSKNTSGKECFEIESLLMALNCDNTDDLKDRLNAAVKTLKKEDFETAFDGNKSDTSEMRELGIEIASMSADYATLKANRDPEAFDLGDKLDGLKDRYAVLSERLNEA